MSVQGVRDSGSITGSLDLGDQVTITNASGTNTITVEEYLSATTSAYDGNLPPDKRLTNLLAVVGRYLNWDHSLFDFSKESIALWNKGPLCPTGTTFVAASGSVTNDFCIDNETTYNETAYSA